MLSHRSTKRYSFSKSLTYVEWGILRSYTRRIRSLLDEGDRLDWESVRTILNPPTTELFFPNLRYLRAARLSDIKIKHLLHMPLPSLISLDLSFVKQEYLCRLQESLESLFNLSPNIRRFRILLIHHDITFSSFFSNYVCQWRNLQTVDCFNITLDADALAHLSRVPALTRLDIPPSAPLPPVDSPLFFSNLHHLTLRSEFLDPISQLLSRTQFPTIMDFSAYIGRCPSKQDFSSFLTSIQKSTIGHSIQELRLEGKRGGDDATDILVLEDLLPCMAFSKLRAIYLDIDWDVNLSDSEMLTLASAWPHLQDLFINVDRGWNTLGGITPNGLLQPLQACRSLSGIGLAIDTRGYTEFCESRASLGLTLPLTFFIDVLDSFIEEDSIPAIAAFLAGIAPCPKFSFRAHKCWWIINRREDHEALWYDAYDRANVTLSQRS